MPFFSILPLLPEPVRIKVIDVGAMELDGERDPYHRLVELGIADVIGFEPVAAECETRNALARPGQTFLPCSLVMAVRRHSTNAIFR